MKKITAALLSICMFAGCSAGTASASGSGSGSASASASSTSSISDPDQTGFESTVDLNTKELDMSEYYYLNDEDPAFEQITFEEAFRLFDEGGTGILVYSYDTCPFCNRAIPVLNEAAKERGIKVYYVDVYEPEMTSECTEEEFNEKLAKLYQCLDPILKKEMNEETGEEEPAFFVPEVVAIKDGVILGHHTSLTDDFSLTDENVQLTDAQHEELLNIYLGLIDAVLAK